MSLAVRNADGAGWTWSYGSADLDEGRVVDRDTVFHLFSGTKLFTATALMRQVESGALSLDAGVELHLDELGLKHSVTLRQLASHSSGLPETLSALLAVHFPPGPGPSAKEARQRFRCSGGRVPGQSVAYRNVNYAILGELVAKVGGASYAQVVQREVLDPLGSKARFAYDPDMLERAATGYMSRWTPMRLLLPLFVSNSRELYGRPRGSLLALRPFELDTAAIGGLLGTPRDFLGLVDEMLREQDGLLRAVTKRAMLSVQAKGAAGIVSREGVGLGWKFGVDQGTAFWNHEGGGPGFCSETRLYPEAEMGMVVMMNRSQDTGLSRLCHQICERIRKEHAQG